MSAFIKEKCFRCGKNLYLDMLPGEYGDKLSQVIDGAEIVREIITYETMSPYAYFEVVCNDCKTKEDEEMTLKYKKLDDEYRERCEKNKNKKCPTCGQRL